MSNSDIEGTKTVINKFITKREPSNPLQPVYKLPSFTYVPPDPPKFIRDAMTINDIDGTSPFVKKELATRDGMKCDDIEGATIRKAY